MSIDPYQDTLVIRVSSPDERIHARLTNQIDLEIWFSPWTFHRYDEGERAYQLGRLGQLAWVAYQRARDSAYQKAYALSAEELALANRPSEDPQRRAYDDALNEMQGEGVSPDGSIRIHTTGMLRWSVEFDRDTPRRLGEVGFISQLLGAFRSLLADREMKATLLKAEHFDMGLPRKWVELMRELREINARRERGSQW